MAFSQWLADKNFDASTNTSWLKTTYLTSSALEADDDLSQPGYFPRSSNNGAMIKEKKATCVVYSESIPCRTGLTHKTNIPRDPDFSLHYALRGLIID